MIAFEFKPGDTFKRLRQLSQVSGVTVQFLVYEVMRLACRNAVRLTYPKTKKVGSDRIEKDMRRIFGIMNNELQLEFNLGARALDFRVIRTKRGSIVGADQALIRPTASLAEMSRHHEKHRTAGGGVTTAGTRTRDIGRWKFVDKMFVGQKAFNNFLRRKKGNVGIMKAGWLPALKYFAALVNGSSRVPSWVERTPFHLGSHRGFISPAGNGRVIAKNEVPWYTTREQARTLDIVHSIAQKDLNKGIEKRLDKLVERFNRGGALKPVRR